MPKEVVQFVRTADDVDDSSSIEVNWSKPEGGGCVQLHVQRHVWRTKPGDPDPAVNAEVWTDLLTRSQINKMIRTLRRARDDAYGADA